MWKRRLAAPARAPGTHAWLVIASLGFLLAQSALHAGPLDASMPLAVIADPLVASLIGIVSFHERIAFQPGQAVMEVVAVAMIVLAVFTLTRSPLVIEVKQPEPARRGAGG